MRRLAATVLVLGLATAGCGASDQSGSSRTLTVLAASSLTGTFTQLADEFEGAHPGVRVKLVFDSSATLAQQAIDRAPGDVLATADRKTMDDAAAGHGIHGDPSAFASNVIVLAVPRDNPAGISSIDDLDRSKVDYLTCVQTAPCGAAAQLLLTADHVSRRPASEEVDVKSVLGKVEAGDADAGLVYRTDVVASAGKVTGIDVPGAADHPNGYFVAPTAGASDSGLADEWVQFLLGTDGQAVLRAAGFGTP
ncbi:molybdate transport system substrate-binding protein [Marmoricola sp. URHA0025 HA25]